MKLNWTALGAGLAVVVPLVVVLASGFGSDPRALRSALIDRPAPAFQLQDLDGKPWSLADLAGEPVVINVWSTWCLPCKAEHPLLLEAAQATPQVRFLGLIYSDDPQKVRRYLRDAGSAYAHLVDPDNRVAIDYGVTGVPETFFIDRRGVLRHKHTGPLDAAILRAWLELVEKS
jgi:cytochrome c biogenesis protein CcmG/thiol:disulfide interchange protein DsbE